MLGFDSAERVIAESINADALIVTTDPVLKTLSQCVEDLLPSLSRACRAHGDGAVMHALIAMAANLAREGGLEDSIAEAFRVNAALLDGRPVSFWPFVKPENGSRMSPSEIGEWFRARLSRLLGVPRRQASAHTGGIKMVSEESDKSRARAEAHGERTLSTRVRREQESLFGPPNRKQPRTAMQLSRLGKAAPAHDHSFP